ASAQKTKATHPDVNTKNVENHLQEIIKNTLILTKAYSNEDILNQYFSNILNSPENPQYIKVLKIIKEEWDPQEKITQKTTDNRPEANSEDLENIFKTAAQEVKLDHSDADVDDIEIYLPEIVEHARILTKAYSNEDDLNQYFFDTLSSPANGQYVEVIKIIREAFKK
ncbi:MAG: hypothetical protein K2X98_01845, partial [Alphaproteobacteria bacterium]|nr:hypothetical protein [Alphaproteobacteria bacterium]